METNQSKPNQNKTVRLILSFVFILISIAMVIYSYIVTEKITALYADYFKDEGTTNIPPECLQIFISTTLPFIGAYLISFVLLFRKFMIRYFIYPMTLFTIFVYYFLYRFLSIGNAYGWMIMILGPLLIVGLGITLVLGIISTQKEKGIYPNKKNPKDIAS